MSFDIDSGAYVAMADGRMAEVLRPFANRVLGPMIVSWLKAMGMSTDAAFLLLHFAAALTFVCSVAWLLIRRGCGWRVVPLLFAPWIVRLGFDLYLPDMLVASLTALFFVALERGRKGLAMFLIVPMVMARESSMIVAGVLVFLAIWDGWKTRNWRYGEIILSSLALVIGIGIVGWISRESSGNINGIGGLSYMPVKAFVNGVYSFTGIKPWNDVYGLKLKCFYIHEPIWKMICPEWMRFGHFTEIGIYEWRPWQIVTTLKIMILGFGALSMWMVAIAIMRAFNISKLRLSSFIEERVEWVRVAFWVGMAFWLLTPISGFSPHRYVGYAWPLMWFCVLPQVGQLRGWRYWSIVIIGGTLAWV